MGSDLSPICSVVTNTSAMCLTVALHIGAFSDPTVGNATLSPVLNNSVLNGSMTL